MESFVDEGKVKQLGISNCYDFELFQALYNQARIKPKVLQNRYVRFLVTKESSKVLETIC